MLIRDQISAQNIFDKWVEFQSLNQLFCLLNEIGHVPKGQEKHPKWRIITGWKNNYLSKIIETAAHSNEEEYL